MSFLVSVPEPPLQMQTSSTRQDVGTDGSNAAGPPRLSPSFDPRRQALFRDGGRLRCLFNHLSMVSDRRSIAVRLVVCTRNRLSDVLG